MYVRVIGRRFTQMNAYFLVMNSKRCIYTSYILYLNLYYKNNGTRIKLDSSKEN